MPDLKRLYDEEMRHLLDAGREFARIHPGAARRLALDEVEERDPAVGRLFQSFSFLAGRIRETQEGEEDRVAGQLLDVAAPGWRDPLPATVIVELIPREGTPLDTVIVPEGSEIRIAPRNGGGEGFNFRLVGPVELAPIRLAGAAIIETSDGTSALRLELRGAVPSLRGFWPDRLVFFLQGEEPACWALRHWLVRRVRGVEIQGRSAKGVGIEATASRSSDSSAARNGARDLIDVLAEVRNFLCADHRSRFLALTGLGDLSVPLSEPLEVLVRFDGTLPHSLAASIGSGTFRLHAVPAINRYLRECEPISLGAERSWYPLQPAKGGEAEILAIHDVQGFSQSDPSRRRSYPGIEAGRSVLSEAEGGCFHEVMVRPRRSGGHRTSIAVRHVDGAKAGEDERLLVRAWLGNGNRPFENVDPGARYAGGQGVPAGYDIVGLTRPTPAFRPGDAGTAAWRMLGSCQRSFRDLLDLRLLRETLLSLHWDEGPGRRDLIDGIRDVECLPTLRMHQGMAEPAAVVSIRLDQEQCQVSDWGRIGRIDAFAEGLHELFRCVAPWDVTVGMRLVVEPAGLVLEHGP